MSESELRIVGSQLLAVSARITAASASVPFGAALTSPTDHVVGSSGVAVALRDAGIQQTLRAELVSDSLRTVGGTPAVAAAEFDSADACLARAF